MTVDNTQEPKEDPKDGEIFDINWDALLKPATGAGSGALKALLALLKKAFPGGHKMIDTVQNLLEEAEQLEKKERDRNLAATRPKPF